MTESDDPVVLARRLAEFRQEHRDLNHAIDRLARINDDPDDPDDLALKRLKKRRLWLKDCIARLESSMIPDEPA